MASIKPTGLKPRLLTTVATIAFAMTVTAADAKPGNGKGNGPPENSVPGRGSLPPSASDNAGENSQWPSFESESDEDEHDEDDDEDEDDDDDEDESEDDDDSSAADTIFWSGIALQSGDGNDTTVSLVNTDGGDTGGVFMIEAYEAGTGTWIGSYTSDPVDPGTGLTFDVEQTLSDAGIVAGDPPDLLLSLSAEFNGTAQARRYTDAIGYAGTANLCGDALEPVSTTFPGAPSSVNPDLVASYRIVNSSDANATGIVRLIDQTTGALLAEWESPVLAASTAVIVSPQALEDEGLIAVDPATLPDTYTVEADFPAGWRLEPTLSGAASSVGFDASNVCVFAASEFEDEDDSDGDVTDGDGTDDDDSDGDGTDGEGTGDDGTDGGDTSEDASV